LAITAALISLYLLHFYIDKHTPEGNAKGTEKVYGVPIDDLDVNAIFYSRVGRAVKPKENHAFANHVRECWDLVGGDQVVFVDWQSLASK